jgi:hypothetical protein
MARIWLVNGRTSLLKRASQRKHRSIKNMARKSRKSRRTRRSARLGNPRRARRFFGRRSRSFFHNPAPGVSGLVTALAWGGAGYAGSKALAVLADTYLPPTVPYRTLIGSGLAGAGAAWIAGTVLKGKAASAAAVTVGAMIPLAEELIAMTPVGPMIGVYEGANVPALPSPAPEGTTPAMSAALSAALSEDSSDNYATATSF